MTRRHRLALALALALLHLTTVACASEAPGTDQGGLSHAAMGHGEVDDPAGSTASPSAAADEAGEDLARRLEAAGPGDTIVVEPGRYRGNFVIRRPVTLEGEGLPVLDGGGEGTVLTIAPGAAGSTVRGLHVMGTGPGPVGTPTGVRIEADEVTVENLLVMDSYMGIQVMSARDAHLVDNTIVGFADGSVTGEMHVTGGEADMTGMGHAGSDSATGTLRGDAITLNNATSAVVAGNDITDVRDGVFLSFARDAAVRDNEVRDSRYAVHAMYATALTAEGNYFDANLAGAILMYGGPFELVGNTIVNSRSPATGFGLVLKDGAGTVLDGNVLAANRVGIKLDNGGATSSAAESAVIRDNTIGLNQVGVELMVASRGAFSGNSFVENTVPVVAEDDVTDVAWTIDGRGNHWSAYKGHDASGDGVGDVPFVQGGTVEHTLTRSPSLAALMSGPAFRLLQAIEDRWAPEDPVALDPRPLMETRSPALERSRRPDPAGTPLGLVGAALVALCALLLVRARAPRTRRA